LDAKGSIGFGADRPLTMTRIYLGTLPTPEVGERVVFDFTADSDPETIRAELQRVQAKRAADAAEETRRLRRLFLEGGESKSDDD
jgi:hypothetical protein